MRQEVGDRRYGRGRQGERRQETGGRRQEIGEGKTRESVGDRM